jgi:hypothetical protein
MKSVLWWMARFYVLIVAILFCSVEQVEAKSLIESIKDGSFSFNKRTKVDAPKAKAQTPVLKSRPLTRSPLPLVQKPKPVPVKVMAAPQKKPALVARFTPPKVVAVAKVIPPKVVPQPKVKGLNPKPTKGLGAKIKENAFAVCEFFVRSTSYSHNEPKSDDDSSAKQSSTTVPLVYPESGKIGTAAVAHGQGISYGDLIVVSNNQGKDVYYLAVDTGSKVISRKASTKLAAMRGIKDTKYSDAIVVDFFSKGNKQVGTEWCNVKVIRCPVDFLSLKSSERARLLEMSVWSNALTKI